MKKFTLTLLAMIFAVTGLSAQVTLAPTVLASAGGYSESGNITLSWTLGEIAVTTLSGGDLILTQGFQQPYAKGTGIKPNLEANWNIYAYPNPVERELNLRFDTDQPANFLIEITDVAGRVISIQQYREVMPGDIVPVEMHNYPQGIYFFKVFSQDKTKLRILSISKI